MHLQRDSTESLFLAKPLPLQDDHMIFIASRIERVEIHPQDSVSLCVFSVQTKDR